RFETPVILDITAKEGLTKIAGRKGTGNSSLKVTGVIGIKCLQISKLENPVWIGQGFDLQLHSLRSESKLDGMRAFVDESIVVELESVPVIKVSSFTAHTTEESGYVANEDLRRGSSRESAQRKVRRGRHQRLCSDIVVYALIAVAEASAAGAS